MNAFDIEQTLTRRGEQQAAGSAQNRCLDAFSVALGQACDGEKWYTSTKELQLASLPFCKACRSVTTLVLIVNDVIPSRLMAAADDPPSNRKRLRASRVPRLRARRVLWRLRATVELRRSIYAVADATEIYFQSDLCDSLEGILWPHRLQKIFFLGDFEFNLPTDGVAWPASLRQLSLGGCFDQPVGEVLWPGSLQELNFGGRFDQSIEEIQWPPNLLRLTFGMCFDHPMRAVKWPDSSREVSFQGDFDQTIGDVRWPASLEKLTLEEAFDQPIIPVVWQSSLAEVSLGYGFDCPIEGVNWPDSITHLSFGEMFNQPIDRVTWPASLADLTIGRVHELIEGAIFISAFNMAIDRATWPASLRRITLGGEFRHSLEGLGVWMPNLEQLCLLPFKRLACRSLLIGIQWPCRLRTLTVHASPWLESVGVPQGVQIVYCKMQEV